MGVDCLSNLSLLNVLGDPIIQSEIINGDQPGKYGIDAAIVCENCPASFRLRAGEVGPIKDSEDSGLLSPLEKNGNLVVTLVAEMLVPNDFLLKCAKHLEHGGNKEAS